MKKNINNKMEFVPELQSEVVNKNHYLYFKHCLSNKNTLEKCITNKKYEKLYDKFTGTSLEKINRINKYFERFIDIINIDLMITTVTYIYIHNKVKNPKQFKRGFGAYDNSIIGRITITIYPSINIIAGDVHWNIEFDYVAFKELDGGYDKRLINESVELPPSNIIKELEFIFYEYLPNFEYSEVSTRTDTESEERLNIYQNKNLHGLMSIESDIKSRQTRQGSLQEKI